MAFRRDGERSRRWQRWLVQHRDELVAVGLPDWMYADEGRWMQFLQDGLDRETGWRVEMLPPAQARRFRDWVLREYGPDPFRCCLRALELHGGCPDGEVHPGTSAVE